MYVTPAGLRDAIGTVELSQRTTPGKRAALPAAKLDAAIAGTLASSDPDYADALQAIATATSALTNRSTYVDGFLAAYSPLPIADAYVPAIIKQIVIALARFDLAANAPSDTVTKRYDDARKDLLLIQSGTLKLPLPTGSSTVEVGFGPQIVGDDPIYTRCSTRAFQNPEFRLP
jgi:phage gp36-like protein